MKRISIFLFALVIAVASGCSKKSAAPKKTSMVKKGTVQSEQVSENQTQSPIIMTKIDKFYDEVKKADLVTIVINKTFLVGNIKVVKDPSGASRVIWPGYRSKKSGRFYPTLKFNSRVLQSKMEKAIISGEPMIYAGGGTAPFDITNVNIRVYNRKGSTTKGFVTLNINNKLSIGNIKVMTGKKGLWVSMPSEKNENGEWHDYAYPIKKGLKKFITSKVLKKYKEIAGSEE